MTPDPRSVSVEPSVGVSRTDSLRAGVTTVGVTLVLLWVIEFIDVIVSHRLDRFGIQPRRIVGLRGIVAAPLLHANWSHLVSNTVPFGVLGLVVALQNVARFWSVVVTVALVSGIGTWLTGSSHSVHIGMSGVIFGLLTYVLVRGFFQRKFLPILVGAVVAFIYGRVLLGVLPTNRAVSWQGHLFGAIGGVGAAYVFDRRRPTDGAGLPS